jgi:hypothetical protein
MGRVGFSFLLPCGSGKSLPHFPTLAMPFPKTSPDELETILQDVLAAVGKNPKNPLHDPHGMTFLQIERTAHTIGQHVATRLTQQALATHAEDQPEQAPCPQCQQSCRLTRKKRRLVSPDGPIDYAEPAAHCVECRRDFFPDAPRIETRRTAV